MLLTGLLASLSLPAGALQVVDVADGHTVTVKISARELTRIGMDGEDRVARVWGLEERMTVEPDADGGQVFIRPAQSAKTAPFSFFVKDDQGDTYTLVAVPVDMPAEAVVLRRRTSRADTNGGAHPYIGNVKALLRAMANGTEPVGYTVAKSNKPVPLWNEAKVTLLRRYSGDLTGEHYRLTNTSSAEMRLEEREFAVLARDIRAVAIDRHVLAPGEATDLYLLREVE